MQCQRGPDVRISGLIQKCDDEFKPDEEAMEEEIRRDEEETEEFIRKYMQNSSEQIPEKFILRITDEVCYEQNIARSKVRITMTGNREKDKEAAYQQLSDDGRPISKEDVSGYEWHHMPNLSLDDGGTECAMVLVEAQYHRRNKHIGAVKQYQRYHKNGY